MSLIAAPTAAEGETTPPSPPLAQGRSGRAGSLVEEGDGRLSSKTYPPVTALAGDAPRQPPLGKGAIELVSVQAQNTPRTFALGVPCYGFNCVGSGGTRNRPLSQSLRIRRTLSGIQCRLWRTAERSGDRSLRGGDGGPSPSLRATSPRRGERQAV